eukprot:1568648-Pyramimonas_sp.AAC.1
MPRKKKSAVSARRCSQEPKMEANARPPRDARRPRATIGAEDVFLFLEPNVQREMRCTKGESACI